MLGYILRRVLIAIPTLFIVSVINFVIFNAPPGDYATVYIMRIEESEGAGSTHAKEEVEAIRKRFGLDQPMYVQYAKWMWGFLRWDLGQSFMYYTGNAKEGKEVNVLIRDRLTYTMLMSVLSLVFINLIAIPVSLWVSTHQYKASDYAFTFIGFIGLATPNFLLALLFLWVVYVNTGQVLFGLFSDPFLGAAWSLPKLLDLLKHLVLPVLIIGTAGTAGTIRVLRATMLDELGTEYTKFERAKGLRELTVIKHTFRVASNPMVAGIGSLLPGLIGGELVTSIVIGLPTLGPMFFDACMSQDVYLASSYLMIITILLVIGNILADILLAYLDPRIRFS